MADEPKYTAVKLVGRHVPDVSVETNENGDKYKVPLPGEFEIGMMFGKTFHVLHRFQAGNVLNADGSHKNAVESKKPSDEPEPDPGEGE